MVASRMPWGDGVAMCWVLPLSVVDRGEPARVGGVARCVEHHQHLQLQLIFLEFLILLRRHGLLLIAGCVGHTSVHSDRVPSCLGVLPNLNHGQDTRTRAGTGPDTRAQGAHNHTLGGPEVVPVVCSTANGL